MLVIRPALRTDEDAIWCMLSPMLKAGETYTLPRDFSRDEAIAYWTSPGHDVFVAEYDGLICGTYYLRANQRGGGAHVANCGYVTAQDSSGKGVATAMCRHSLVQAAKRGFRAMQFNFVVSSNVRAIELWKRLGFNIIGTIPAAFDHPTYGLVDALVMHRFLETN